MRGACSELRHAPGAVALSARKQTLQVRIRRALSGHPNQSPGQRALLSVAKRSHPAVRQVWAQLQREAHTWTVLPLARMRAIEPAVSAAEQMERTATICKAIAAERAPFSRFSEPWHKLHTTGVPSAFRACAAPGAAERSDTHDASKCVHALCYITCMRSAHTAAARSTRHQPRAAACACGGGAMCAPQAQAQ